MSGAESGGAARRPRREFYSIGEVCEMVGLKPHVLRYWETQFAEISPTKNRAGIRVYRASDVERIALIQRLLYEEKYSIVGARQQLARLAAAQGEGGGSAHALEDSFLRSLRSELEQLAQLLDVSAG